jgi:nucleoside-diphosphate-sugar epimerase
MREEASESLEEYRKANVDGTMALARQAADAGVRRFVFISSIKVNGEETTPDRPFTADSPAAPRDGYGVSKHEAEQALRALAGESGMEVVIIRPVLVYGPGVKANFRAMLRAVQRGLPLPLGAVQNRRSLVAVDNLVNLVTCCLRHPAAAGQTFLVSDGEDLSTPELLRRAGQAMGRRARLLPVPVPLMETAGRMLGKRDMVRRLCSSLAVDIAKTRQTLSWSPPISVDEALHLTVESFLYEQGVR